mgnify:CR=1 FL=1
MWMIGACVWVPNPDKADDEVGEGTPDGVYCDDMAIAAVSATYAYQPTLVNDDTPEAMFEWVAVGLPDGLVIDPQSGEIFGGFDLARADAVFGKTSAIKWHVSFSELECIQQL